MIKDYHIHPRLMYAPEEFDAFAEMAIKKGIQEICITDHMPLDGLGNPPDRIPFGTVEEYYKRGRRLEDEYKGRLSIKIGIEIDFHPTLIHEIEEILKTGEFDFVIGSTHLQSIKKLDIFKTVKTRNEFAAKVWENTILAAQSGYFDAIAHIDVYKSIFANTHRYDLCDDGFSEEKHTEMIEKALNTIKEQNLFLELNPHLAVLQSDVSCVYPSETIVEKALTKGIRFSYGSDAHVFQEVGSLLDELRQHPIYGQALMTWENTM